MTAKEEILELMEGLPDAPTYADAFERLRPLYNREVAPIIAQYGNPPCPPGHWRRDITGSAEAEEQKQVKADKADLLRLMQLLPEDAAPIESVDEAMYKLVLSYNIAKAIREIVKGQGISDDEARQLMAQWRG